MKQLYSALLIMTVSASCCGSTPFKDPRALVARKALESIIKGDTSAFMMNIGASGLSLGTDGDVISKASLTSEFNKRKGAYCEIFGCGRSPGIKKFVKEMDLNDPRIGNIAAGGYQVSFFKMTNKVRNSFGDITIVLEKRRGRIYMVALEYE